MHRSEAERQAIINECSLMKFLNSDYLVKCFDVHDFDGRMWIFLELMEGGSLDKVIECQKG